MADINDYRPGDMETTILRKILARLQALGVGTTVDANIYRPGDGTIEILRKILNQLGG